LRDAQNVAGGVFEPGHLGASGCDPHSKVILFEPGIALELDARSVEFLNGGGDIRDLPTQRGIGVRLDRLNCCYP
jgi:hypothetical protein